VVTLLKQAGRRNDAGLAEKISRTLRAEALRQPAPVEHALGVAAKSRSILRTLFSLRSRSNSARSVSDNSLPRARIAPLGLVHPLT
jgi:hypothetical protein